MTRALIIWRFSIPPKPLLRAKHTAWQTNEPAHKIEKGQLYELIGINNAQRVYVTLPNSEYGEEDFSHGGWHILSFDQVY